MKLKFILWVGLLLYGVQWIYHNIAYYTLIKLNEGNYINMLSEINQMNNAGSLYAIIIILCVGFLCLIEIEKKPKKKKGRKKKNGKKI